MSDANTHNNINKTTEFHHNMIGNNNKQNTS